MDIDRVKEFVRHVTGGKTVCDFCFAHGAEACGERKCEDVIMRILTEGNEDERK